MSATARSDPFLENGLPSNIEAERSILGAILLDNSVCNQAVELLKRDDFFLDSHRKIFDKMLVLSERGSPIDLVTLSDELRKACEFEQVGGATYIASLIDGVPRTDTIEPYAKIVREKALRRALILLGNSLLYRIFDDEADVAAILGWITRAQEEIQKELWLIDDGGPSPLVHASQMEKIPRAYPIVENFLFRNATTQVFAPGGSGKSILALDLALSIAQFGPVVYLIAEAPEEYPPRIEAWCAHHRASVGGLHLWTEPVMLFDARSVDGFLRRVVPLAPALIVIDPLASCFVGGDENATGDMVKAVYALNRIRQKTGAALLIVHHTGWAEAHERGNTSLRNACRVVARLSNNDGLLKLNCEKNNGVAFETRHFRLVEKQLDAERSSVVVLPACQVDMRDAGITKRQREILECLALTINREGLGAADISDNVHVAKSTVSVALSRLLDLGLVEKNGRFVLITERGLREAERGETGEQNRGAAIELALNWPVEQSACASPGSVRFNSSSIEKSGKFNAVQSEFNAPGSSSVHLFNRLSLREGDELNK